MTKQKKKTHNRESTINDISLEMKNIKDEIKEIDEIKNNSVEKKERVKDVKEDIHEVVKKMDKPVKKHHIWGGIGIIIGIIIAILVISIFSFKYINYIEQESYIEGAQDMAQSIYNTVNTNGGAVISVGGNKITVAKYEKTLKISE